MRTYIILPETLVFFLPIILVLFPVIFFSQFGVGLCCSSLVPLLYIFCLPVAPLMCSCPASWVPLVPVLLFWGSATLPLHFTWGHWEDLHMPYRGTLLALFCSSEQYNTSWSRCCMYCLYSPEMCLLKLLPSMPCLPQYLSKLSPAFVAIIGMFLCWCIKIYLGASERHLSCSMVRVKRK